MTRMARVRRQLSLFVPEPGRSVVDDVRRRCDPKQHAIIPAHVTLCRDEEIEPWAALEAALSSLAAVDIELSWSAPKLMADGCVLLPAAGSTASYDELRHAILGPDCGRQAPHITLVHPRNGVDDEGIAAALAANGLPTAVRFDEIVLIEQADGGAWTVLQRYPG